MADAVFPLIDTHANVVQFRRQGHWEEWGIANPHELLRTLSRAVDRPRFDAETQQLLIRTAARGARGGRLRVFSLAKFPSPASLASVGS
ncbi:hypothetical protein [Glutamicibacter sp. PS]|uniref:hypothetical protein n=1 Tax=Glutamicibacter sp. PS TaxID=3075634 RepID=UPI002844ACEB|nr:hypothetical protein [Glutamicibacter sp. PS]MDR4533819.1 hypothetical protein [Glutamicibacter sp. PS]